jgi:citrate lyase beta subunit
VRRDSERRTRSALSTLLDASGAPPRVTIWCMIEMHAAGFAAVCRQGREFGFDGKTLIHPMQIEAADAAFASGAEEVAWSRRVIAAHAAAEARGEGVVLVDGRLVETLHIERAHRLFDPGRGDRTDGGGRRTGPRFR